MRFPGLTSFLCGLLMPWFLCLASCVSPGAGGSPSRPVSAAVKARLRQPVAVVFLGLQDQISYQQPAGSRDVFLRSVGDSHQIWSDILPVAAGAGQGAVVLLPFLAAAMVVPPLTWLASSGGTVSPRKVEAATKKLRSQAPPGNWGDLVRRSVVRHWAASGRPFSRVNTCDAAMLRLGYDPSGRAALAKAEENTLLHLHVAGPALTMEGDQSNPRIAPGLTIYWKVIDTKTGLVLARGTITERSGRQKTLLQWMRDPEGAMGLQVELENAVHRAGGRLAGELRCTPPWIPKSWINPDR
jgi:hypothetical protein